MAERSIHLVGGVPLDAREVFDLTGASFSPLAGLRLRPES
jgi:hypothetical protein